MIYKGEIVNILRPLIYCILMRIYGLNSYKPYLISLLIDILRYILQKKIKFFQIHDKIEY